MTDPDRVPIAGPVFTERCWTPIFLAIVYGPPILAVAGGLYLALRRSRWPRAARAALALVLAPAIVLGSVAVVATVKHRRTSPTRCGPSRSTRSIGSGEDHTASCRCLVQVALRSHDHPAEHHVQRLRRLRLRLLSRLAI